MSALTFRGTHADLMRSLNLIPQVLSGKVPDDLGLRELLFGELGRTVLRLAWGDFATKMAGGTGADGIRWQPLAEATLLRRQRSGREDSDILRETLRLMRSLEPGTGAAPANPDQVFEVLKDGVRVGSAAPHADFHQYGVPDRTPARPFLPPDDEIPPGWESEIDRALERGMVQVITRMVEAGGVP